MQTTVQCVSVIASTQMCGWSRYDDNGDYASSCFRQSAVVSGHAVKWYNTTTGQQLSPTETECKGSILSFSAVQFLYDVAALIHLG